jgi:hypothetical protein
LTRIRVAQKARIPCDRQVHAEVLSRGGCWRNGRRGHRGNIAAVCSATKSATLTCNEGLTSRYTRGAASYPLTNNVKIVARRGKICRIVIGTGVKKATNSIAKNAFGIG